jgi:photosystem II stability/assembly factor-like uncharacterized protein
LFLIDTSVRSHNPNGDLYVSGEGDGLLRSVDDGATWSLVGYIPRSCVVTDAAGITCTGKSDVTVRPNSPVRSKDHGVTWQPWSVPDLADQYGSELDVVAARGETVYVGGKPGLATKGQIARSDDGGLTFHLLSTSPQATELQVLRNGHVFANDGLSGGTYRSADEGATWTKLSLRLSLPLAEDAHGVLYRAYGDSLQTSNDEGDTWSAVETNRTLPDEHPPIGAIWFGPADAMYLVTQGEASFSVVRDPWALYGSDDLGRHWTAFPARLPHAVVVTAALDKAGRLLVATNGGVYRLE